jgi:endonuclease/exonuclease/phosphatase family metal-dependent hydrolase
MSDHDIRCVVDFAAHLINPSPLFTMQRSFHVPRSLGGILAALLIVFNLHAQTTNTIVRVMAANLNGNIQSYQPFAFRIFQGLKPDIVAIQEFNYSNNSPANFRAMVDAAFGTNFFYFRENYTANGPIPNGIISRYPISASGSWPDTLQSQPNRGYAWAQIHLPGTNDLYVVSVHFLTSSATTRASEAANLKALIQANFPNNAWVIVAGDLNTDTRTESAMITLGSFLSDNPVPTDAEIGGNSFTSINRNHPHDYVLPSFSLTNLMTVSIFPSHSFSKGLVFDSRVYTPLSDVAPVQFGDSTNAQHMAVLKDFKVTWLVTNGPVIVPATLSAPALNASGQFQFAVTGSVGSNYIVQISTNLTASNWLSLQTNSAPFNYVETNFASYPQRFYRAIALP